MMQQLNYLQAMLKVIRIGDYLRGNIIYIAFSSILGIVVPYTSFQLLPLILALLFFIFIVLKKPLFLLFLTIISFAIFLGWFSYIDDLNVTSLSPSNKQLSFQLIAPTDINGNKLSAVIKTSSNEKVQLSYIFKSQQEKEDVSKYLKVGVNCIVEGVLKAPEPAKNLNAFNYKNYLYQKEIHWIFQPSEILLSQCQEGKTSIYQRLLETREFGIEFINKHFLPDVSGIIQALIFGERSNITESVLLSYQALGVVHLLAISGLHVGFLTGFFYYLCIRIGLTREVSVYLLLGILPFYMILAGGAPSVIRACLMTMIILVSIKWERALTPLDAISISCLVLLMWNPYLLFQVGFQLSYTVSLALILSSSIILRTYQSFLATTLAVTTIAQLSALPIILYYFYEISLWSIPLNLILVPLYSVVLLPLSVTTFLSLLIFEPVGVLEVKMLTVLLRVTNEIVLIFNKIPHAIITFGKPSVFLLFLYYVVVLLLFLQWEQRKRVIHMVCLFVFVLVLDYFSLYLSPKGEVTVLDVGQGDSIFIQLPYNRAVYLIDAAEKMSFPQEKWQIRTDEFSVGKDVILPFLKSKGITKIDNLILTHGDFDHIGSAKKLLEKLSVKQITVGEGEINKQEQELVNIAKKKGVSMKNVSAGDGWSIGDFYFSVVSPTGDERGRENDSSIVIYSVLGGKRWLFAGDLEKDGELQLIQRYQQLKVDVLKVGHHGSDTSSTQVFLDAIQPKIAIISVGKNNRYRHPHEDVIDRFQERRVKIYRTDQHGAIRFIFSEKGGTFQQTLP